MIRKEKTETGSDIVWSGFENGIGASPHKGIANIQNANINTETGEVMCSFSRTQQSQTNSITNGTLTPSNTSHLDVTLSGVTAFKAGIWISVGAGITGLSAGNYYVLASSGPVNVGIANILLSATYGGSAVTFTASGSAVFTIISNMGQALDYTIETYCDTNKAIQYRYYILDSNAFVWVQDTGVSITGATWFCPDLSPVTGASGIEELNGWLFVFGASSGGIQTKPTCWLGTSNPGWNSITFGTSLNPNVSHFAYSGHQGKIYYCDGQFIGSIFPNSSLDSGLANIQSFASFTASSTTGTITDLISGSLPLTKNAAGTVLRIPAVFFAPNGGTIPSALSASVLYWIQYIVGGATFQVYAAQTGGSALNIASGASGTQYFNTFYPIGAVSAGNGSDTWTFTPQALNLPTFETSTSLVEIGNTVIIGGKTNTLYPWDQVAPLPSSLIELPEDDVHYMIAVNNMAYIFAGHKGNVYLTNGSTASAVISIPDYCAGVPGTPSTYVEPYFQWGGADYIRGRVYFSIQDQTASKAGNCGGVWSFVPTQNLFYGQDVGLSLRLENENSYATYNGLANLVIGNQNQSAIGVQYFSAWTSTISSPTYGIDTSGTGTLTAATIESDEIPTGTMLNKKTFSQIEYKLSTPLISGENVAINYRQSLTDTWHTCGTVKIDASNNQPIISGYFTANFELSQILQLQVVLSPITSSIGSFIRLNEIRIRT